MVAFSNLTITEFKKNKKTKGKKEPEEATAPM